MTKIFISGSITIIKIDEQIKTRLDNIIQQNHNILIGDANGADKAVQIYLAEKKYSKVNVYCSGNTCRNNIGNWQVINVEVPSKVKGRKFYMAKDKQMAIDSDYGFMLWDGKSAGTINNLLNLITSNKIGLIYLFSEKTFNTIKNLISFEKLIKLCNPSDIDRINQKIPFIKRMADIKHSVQEKLLFDGVREDSSASYSTSGMKTTNRTNNSGQLKKLEETLWRTADTLRANTDLKSTEYSTPVLGLIFLKFADNNYSNYEQEINNEFKKLKGTRREKPIHEIAIEKCGFYLPDFARYNYLVNLPEEKEIDKAVKEAMIAVEEYKPELKGILPQDEYFRLTRTDKTIPAKLLKSFSNIPSDASGDMFGQIYEYFLGNFAKAEGQGGGEFFTPRSVVRLMVEIIEPHNGTVFDPACGSGGMFVQSAKFIEERKNNDNGDTSLFVYGQEKTLETVKLAKMNIAVNGLRGDIRQANTYYEDLFGSFEKFDYVLTNPPFNVDDVNLSRVENDKRFNTYGVPRNKSKTKKKDKGTETVPNGNYLWINLFATSLKPTGRAALVMANSASDARHSEANIRKTLIEKNLIYGMLSLPSNMFYTVTLPATLWFFDKEKRDEKILFIDTRNVFTQIDRAHREFSEEQIQDISIISRLHRGNRKSFIELVHSYFENGFTQLKENRASLKEVSEKVSNLLTEYKAKENPNFKPIIESSKTLLSKYAQYEKSFEISDIDKYNASQINLYIETKPFFENLHILLKAVDKQVRLIEKENKRNKDLKTLKTELEELHKEVKETEYFFTHINWLQKRFPTAKYEDVTGLCKLACLEEVKEQDYSLNPGRYVGVVIEEDGKTEEEFISEIVGLNDELINLNNDARKLETIITKNISQIAGDE